MPGIIGTRSLAAFLILCITQLGMVQAVHAALIDTQTVMQLEDRAGAISSVQAQLGRADVRQALIGLGVDPQHAHARSPTPRSRSISTSCRPAAMPRGSCW